MLSSPASDAEPARRPFRKSLSGRVLVLTAIVWVGLIALLHLALRQVIRPAFESLETSLLVRDLERAEAAVVREGESLGAMATDYAVWDDMHAFALEPSDAFRDASLSTALATLSLDAFMVLDARGKPLYVSLAEGAHGSELDAERFVSAFPSLVAVSDRPSPRDDLHRTGVVRFSSGELYLVAGNPILPSARVGPAVGTVILLRRLAGPYLLKIAEQVRLPFQLLADQRTGTAPSARDALVRFLGSEVGAQAWIRDPGGQVVARLELTRPSLILRQGEATVRMASLSSLLVLSLVLGVLVVMLQAAIVGPLRHLTQSVESVGRTGKLETQMELEREDEIGVLARNFENMLRSLGERTRSLEILASRDALTGAYNRRYIMGFLEQEVESALRYQHGLAVALIDIDHFKRINDTVGHQGGDRVLCAVANALETTLRETDRVGRYGGEEFLVVMPHQTEEGAQVAAERLRAAVESAGAGGNVQRVTVSIGVCVWREHSAHGLLAAADRNLYRAKERGRNQVSADEIPLGMLPASSRAVPRSRGSRH